MVLLHGIKFLCGRSKPQRVRRSGSEPMLLNHNESHTREAVAFAAFAAFVLLNRAGPLFIPT